MYIIVERAKFSLEALKKSLLWR